MASQIITSRVPQQGDPVEVLLARLLAVQAQRVTGTALASATRTGTTQSFDIDTQGFRGLMVFLNVSAIPGTGNVSLRIRARDPVSGLYGVTFTGSTFVTATGLYTAIFTPGYGSFGGGSAPNLGGAGLLMGDIIRVEVAHQNADPYTYSVGYILVP